MPRRCVACGWVSWVARASGGCAECMGHARFDIPVPSPDRPCPGQAGNTVQAGQQVRTKHELLLMSMKHVVVIRHTW